MIPFASLLETFTFSLSFLAVLFFGFFLPGYLLLRHLAPKRALSSVEILLFSSALSIGIIDFALLLLGSFSYALSTSIISIFYACFYALLFGLFYFRKIQLFPKKTPPLLDTRKSVLLASVLLFFIFFVKTFYLSGTILPTSTDFGHHLYWSKLISDTQSLPVYEKSEIVLRDGSYSVSEPAAISDFIIGEHLPLSFLHIFIGSSYFGTFPVLFLFLLNLFSVLAYSLLFYLLLSYIAKENKWQDIKDSSFFLLGLLAFGSVFALASPEMKFVSGGVIGNLFGNFFLPLIFIAFFRFLVEKRPSHLAIFFLLIATLAYTHHLSTFILLYVLVFFTFVLLLFFQKKFFLYVKSWFTMALKPAPLFTLLSIGCFAFFVTMPTYLETNAVTTAVGTPTKTTRTGLTLFQLTSSNSAYTLGLSFVGLVLIAGLAVLRRNLAAAFLFAYGSVLLIMTLAPTLLLVDIPSNRISHYLGYPLTLLALFATFFLYQKYRESIPSLEFRNPIVIAGCLVFFLAFIAPGLEDNSQTLTTNNQALFVQETFTASEYLARNVSSTDLILKDHNFIQASDTWMKLFFNKGYDYPLSRSYFKRYEDNPEREQCTLAMIATPNTVFGQKCFTDLPVRFLVVNPKYDLGQFTKSSQFSLVYTSANVAIFEVKKP